MKNYYYNHNYLDLESLDSFTDSFWKGVISKLETNQEAYVSFTLMYEDSVWLSNLMPIKNDPFSRHHLKRSILGGPVGSYLRIHESMDLIKCYYQYDIR
jgi:hypothetical protein